MSNLLKGKPSNRLAIPSLRVEVYYDNGSWFYLGLNDLGYYGRLLDGRIVFNAFKRKNNRLTMEQYNQLKLGQ